MASHASHIQKYVINGKKVVIFMLESAIERKFRTGVQAKGCFPMKIQPTIAGLPDRCVFLGQGRAVFVELKQTHGRLSPVQKAIHSRLLVRGYRVYTLFGADDVAWFIQEELPSMIEDYWPQKDFLPAGTHAHGGGKHAVRSE